MPSSPDHGRWISPRVGLIVMLAISALLIVLVWMAAPPNADWRENLRLAVVLIGGTWLIAAFFYTLSRWLRRR